MQEQNTRYKKVRDKLQSCTESGMRDSIVITTLGQHRHHNNKRKHHEQDPNTKWMGWTTNNYSNNK